ncbi:MBL fold metallo-hydrolase [Kosmotoga pacifica]|uniref:MBL fold metallo-hydrolase n=1 Tax=Kosmotoga pacifica TaxID=1330330 RepID=UPI00069C7875|nr:MBL fold metallo-hydrolase [Kosmotoga pacifica]
MVSIFRIKSGIINLYLLKGKDGYLLVDTGYRYTDFEKVLQNEKINWKDINVILITHHHADHVAALADVLKRTEARLIIHKKEVPFLEAGKIDKDFKPLNFRVKIAMAFSLVSRFKPVKLRECDIVMENESEILRDFGIEGKILHTPGHTKGSISVLLDDGSAIVGDIAMNFLGFLGLKKRPMIAYDYDGVFKSWEKMLDAGAKIIYPSHGEPFPALELAEMLKQFAQGEKIWRT